MGLLAAAVGSLSALDDVGNTPSPIDDFWYGDPGMESDSGIRISPQGALNISTVWKCVAWWFRMYGTLPHKLFERTTVMDRPAAIEAVDHPLYEVIHCSPNPSMTAAYFHGMIAADKKLWGNFYAFIGRGSNGKPSYLVRVRPDYVTPTIAKGQFWFDIRGDDGLPKRFYPDEILHLPGMGFDGRVGYSPIRMQMNLLGWNRATARYGAQFFKNASRPSGLVITDNPLKPEAKKDLIANLQRSGKDAGRLVLIEGATKFEKLTMDQDEAQFILTYQGQEEDICGIMEVKPHEVGIMRNMTNNNVEQETISSVTRFLSPFCVDTEQQMNLQLLSDVPSSGRGGGTERSRYFFQSELKALLRGDTAAQTAHLEKMFDRGVYSGNDCAEFLGLPPFEGGDIRFINRAYGPVDMAREWSKLSQNNPSGADRRAPDPAKAERVPLASFTENGERIRESYSLLFADAAGRVVARKKPAEREKYAAIAFAPVFAALSCALAIEVKSEFTDRYLAALCKRAALWESELISVEELERAMAALDAHGKGE